MESDRMKTARMVIGVAGVAFIAVGVRATAQMTLPDGPNRALVMRACTACHDLDMVLGAGGRSREGWEGTVEDMISFGMSLSAADRRLVVEYLATFLPVPSR
jgi:hypothetical protein